MAAVSIALSEGLGEFRVRDITVPGGRSAF